MAELDQPDNLNHGDITSQSDVIFVKPKKKRRWLLGLLILLLLVAGGVTIFSFFAAKTSFTFSQMFVSLKDAPKITPDETTPIKALYQDPDRTNILVLGIRGEKDPDGGLLSDVNMILSIKKSTGQIAMISIPRDLYVDIPNFNKKERINFAYAYGFQKGGVAGGIVYAKKVFENVSNVSIDDVVVVNFESFRDIINVLGGVTVNLDKPFKEEKQFAGETLINLPAGPNTLDGKTALYYVRSRYSTSDFDRMRRQQDVILAIQKKLLSLGVLTNPKKIFGLLDSLGKNVRTTLDSDKITSLISMARSIKTTNVIRRTFNTTPEGLLYEITNGAYHLLPVGDNFDKIQQAIKDIFQTQ